MTNLIKQNTKTLVMHRTTNYIMASFILMAALLYIYFANTTVRAVTVLEKTKQEMQSLSVKVGEMESEMLTIENGLNTEKAAQLGFVEVNNPIFIMRSSQSVALSLKTN